VTNTVAYYFTELITAVKKIQHKHGFRISLELPVLVEEEDKAPECHEDHSGELAHFKCPRNVWNVV